MARGYEVSSSDEARLLREILKMQRITASAIINGGGGGGGGSTSENFTIGDGQSGTPTNGSTIYTNANISGKSIAFYKNGYGFLTEGTGSNQYQRNGGGTGTTVTLQGGSIFSTDEIYTIQY